VGVGGREKRREGGEEGFRPRGVEGETSVPAAVEISESLFFSDGLHLTETVFVRPKLSSDRHAMYTTRSIPPCPYLFPLVEVGLGGVSAPQIGPA